MMDAMKAVLAHPPTLSPTPVTPRLEVKVPADVEDKTGWSVGRALKDAIGDAVDAALKEWLPQAWDMFRYIVVRRLLAETEEWMDWNADKELFRLRIPIRFLRWIPLGGWSVVTVGELKAVAQNYGLV